MKRTLILPIVLIILSAGAAIPYALEGDWRRVAYWLCAAGLQAVVTF